MLASLQSLETHPSMVGDWRVDVDEVNRWIFKNLVVRSVPVGDPEFVRYLVQFVFVSTAYRYDFSIWMALICLRPIRPLPINAIFK